MVIPNNIAKYLFIKQDALTFAAFLLLYVLDNRSKYGGIMVKKYGTLGFILAISAYSSMQSMHTAVKCIAAAFQPWKDAKNEYVLLKNSPEQLEGGLKDGFWTLADQETTEYVRTLTKDKELMVVIDPRIQQGAAAYQDISGKQRIIFLDPAYAYTIKRGERFFTGSTHQENFNKLGDAFAEYQQNVSSIGNNMRQDIQKQLASIPEDAEKDYLKVANDGLKLIHDTISDYDKKTKKPEEIDAAILHENGHNLHKDNVRTILSHVLTPIGLIALDQSICKSILTLKPSLKSNIFAKSGATALAAGCYYMSWPYVKAALSREKERQADSVAIQANNATLLGGMLHHAKEDFHHFLPGIKNKGLLAEHPSDYKRYKRYESELLGRMAQEKQNE